MLERLDEVLHRAAVQRRADGVGAALGGHHHDRDLVAGGAQPVEHLEPAEVGQVHVEQHQVGAELVDEPSASAPVWAVPTTSKPSVCSTKRAWMRATMKSSSTTSTRDHGRSPCRHGRPHAAGRTTELGAALLGGPVDLDPAAALGADQLHQRQPDAAAAEHVGLGREAAHEDGVAQVVGHARAVVAHPQVHGARRPP